ncbi:Trypsin-like serine protease, partial [Coemansia helicoidea]
LTAANFAEFRGGVLAKNGEQTSCEIGLIDISAAFVAANCFDYTGNGAVDASTKYSAWIIPTAEGTSVMRAAIDPKDIHVHPAYDPKTLANNIAVVQFNKGVVAPYVSYINTDLDLPDTQLGYVRRTFNDKKKVWNPLQLALQSGDSSGCAESSALYGANEGWLACTSAATSSVYRDSCSVPFGTLYYATSGQIVLSAIFSHAVVQAKSTCGDGSAPAWHSYYTQLWPHIGLAVSVLGRSLDVYSNLTPMNATLKDIRSMSIPSNTAPPRGAIVAGGNFYPLQGADQGEDKDQDQDTHSSEADEPTSSDEKKSSSHHDKSSRHDRSSRQDDKTSDQDDK